MATRKPLKIDIKPSKVGSLNRLVGGPALKNIPKVEKLAKSGSAAIRKKANFALGFVRKVAENRQKKRRSRSLLAR